MTPKFLIKLAKEEEQPKPLKKVDPLAKVIAMQMGLNPLLLETDMSTAMKILTNKLKNQEIKTAGADNKKILDPAGAVNRFASWHTIQPITDAAAKMFRVIYSPWIQGTGVTGACDAMAYIRSILDPNVIKGMGENVLSMNKFQNIFNKNNMGSFGRNGAQSLASK